MIEPIRVASDNGGQLQLQRLGAAPTSGPVVLLLHGAMSDSRVFLPAEHGLARYLAEQGCCVYVADLRGHGDSQPALGGPQPIRMWDLLQADIPALLEWLRSEHPDQRLFVVSHGWGGVWLAVEWLAGKWDIARKHLEGKCFFPGCEGTHPQPVQ